MSRHIVPASLALTFGVTCLFALQTTSTTGSLRTHPSASLSARLHHQALSPSTARRVATTLPPVTTPPVTAAQPTVSSTTAPPAPVATTVPPTYSTATTVPPAAPSTGLTSDAVAAWTRVAICEEGGWGQHTFGGGYVGDLGITTSNWYANGGGADLSPAAQVAVAQRISGGYVPDEYGCSGW